MNREELSIYTLFAVVLQAKIELTKITTPPKREVEVVQEVEGYLQKPLIAETKLTIIYPAHPFPKGWCTYYVSTKRIIPWSGNANQWLKNSKKFGYETGNEPKVGAVIVTNESRWGHVGFVEAIGNDSIIISEMNYTGFNRISYRTLSRSSRVIKGYIY